MLMTFVALTIGISLHQERRTEHVLEALRDLSSPRALVLRDGQRCRIAGREVVRLAKVLPRSVALRMAIMGKHERMSAERAYELGLVTEVVPHEDLLTRAKEIAEIVNSNAPLAVRGTRLAIHKTLGLPMHEAELLAESFRERVTRTEDALEGPRAFVEKRAPNWQAR